MTISYSSAVDRHLAANAIEPRRIVPLFATVAPPPEGEPAPNRVLFAGRVVPSKGLASLIRAAPGLDAEFVVCGDGWQLEEMRRLARTLGVGERFDFRGWVSPQELAHELSLASLLVIPSIWPEPFGLVGIEALQARRPVVASATGGIADWLRDGVSGLLCPPGDAPALASAVAELLADPQRRRRMGEAGRRDVLERFSPSRHTDALLEAYAGARAGWRMRPPAPAGGGDR
jgi:glycogen(starch) synthase